MIFKRLKKVTKEQEREFEENLAKENIGAKDKFAMLISSLLMIILPCTLVLIGISLLAMWLFGLL